MALAPSRREVYGAAVSRGLDWTATVSGAALMVSAAGMVAWQDARDAATVHVAGQVVALDCEHASASCFPIVEFTAPDGVARRTRGVEERSAATFEVGAEWIPVFYHSDTGVATLRGETSPLAAIAVLAMLIGSGLLGWGWSGLVDSPRVEPAAWWPRGVAGVLGVAGCVVAYGVVGWAYLGASTAVPMALVFAASIGPAAIRLGQRADDARLWPPLVSYGLAILGLVAAVGVLVSPVSLREGLLASAPFAAALTLPLQARLWPAMERWRRAREEVLDRRARLSRALTAAEGATEIVVRIDSWDFDTRMAKIVRRGPDGDFPPMEASLNAFVGALVEAGGWYLLAEPIIEQRAKPTSGGYREVELEDVLTTAQRAEALGPDLERGARGELSGDPPAWLFPVPLVVCVAGSVLGGVVLADAAPPLSGRPIPATGLVEKLDFALVRVGQVAESTAWPGLEVGYPCSVRVEPTGRSQQTCHVAVSCGGLDVYPGGSGGYTRCISSRSGAIVGEDTSMDDGDPAIRLDTRIDRVVVRARAGVRDRSVTIALSPQ